MAKDRTTKSYEYSNPHPKGIKSHSDCVYRAISIATGKEWLQVYDELTALGRELLAPPNDKLTYTTYLDRIADRIDAKHPNGKRRTGKDVAALDPSRVYVVRMANHLATVKGGKVRDTWNSSDKSAYLIWELR